MVWAHGGGQISGSGANELYDGGHFAREGVVLVTCNRRLGAEGFLYLEELFGEGIGPGNLGMQDLICVLQWVADNIQALVAIRIMSLCLENLVVLRQPKPPLPPLAAWGWCTRPSSKAAATQSSDQPPQLQLPSCDRTTEHTSR